jgi:hypothetical protein
MTTIATLTSPLRRETDSTRFVGALRDAQQAQQDIVMPLSNLCLDDAASTLTFTRPDGEPFLLSTGVADTLAASFTRTAWRQITERLNIPLPYADRLVANHGDLAALNVNLLADRDARSGLFRFWLADDGIVLRAVLSDQYRVMDNYSALQAIIAGMQSADIGLGACEVDVDLTPDRFRMRIAVPQIAVAAPDLLAGYRNPFPRDGSAHSQPDQPLMWAGLEVSNSETGGGAFSVAPRMVVMVCRNGLTRSVDMLRSVHLGAKLDDGVVTWSDESRRLQAELLTSQVRDAVAQFVSTDYLQAQVDEMRAARALPVESPTAAVALVVKQQEFTEAEHARIMDAFMRGGDHTVLGVGQAVTAAAQLADNGDRQSQMEATFWNIISGAPAIAAARS